MEFLINIYSKLSSDSITAHDNKHSEFKKKTPICYSNDYNITACGLEKTHPFDSCKYRNGK